MPAKKRVSQKILGSDMAKVDAHIIQPEEYEEIPELTEEMLERGVLKKGGRRVTNTRNLVTVRLPADVIERWRATGPGWETRMAERLRKVR